MSDGRPNRRRVVITGMGAISPLGLTVDELWQGLVEGRSGIDFISLGDPAAAGYPVMIDGEVRGFDPSNYMDRKDARRMARFSQLAVAAAQEAVRAARLDTEREDGSHIGVLLGNGNGGYPDIDEAMRVIVRGRGMRIDPFYLAKTLPNMAASNISMWFQAKGHIGTISTACSAATQAMGQAGEVIRRGAADVMITGGTEAGLGELGLAAFCVMRVLSTESEHPEKASRPFDAKRDGFVCSEGAAIFTFENLDHAQARGAPILAEVAGFASSADGYHLVVPCEDGDGAARCMRWALEDAGVAPRDVDYINAHGTSTPLNDAVETKAIKTVLRERAYHTPISATKSMIGHALGASGALESVACVKTLETGIIHPTINYEFPDPECDLDYVPNAARRADVRAVLKNSFGFGGQNACLVFKRFEG